MFLKGRFPNSLHLSLLGLLCVTCIPTVVSAQDAVCQTAESQTPAAISGGPYVASTGQNIAFDGGGSWSFDGPIIYYYWDFGDGSWGTGPNPSHQYAAEGAYTVTLTVCDDLWNCASSQSYATAGAVNVPARINFDELPNNVIVADQYFNQYGVRFYSGTPSSPLHTSQSCGPCSTTSLPNFVTTKPNDSGIVNVEFAQPVNNLTFYMIGVDVFFDPFAVVDVYRGGSFYASYPVYGNGTRTVGFTLGSMDNISKVVIRSITDPLGIGFDDFTFNVPSDIKITSGRVSGYLNGTTQNTLLGGDIALYATPLPGGFAGGTYSWTFTGPREVLTGTTSSSVNFRSTDLGTIIATVTYTKNGLTASGSVTINSILPTVTSFSGQQISDTISSLLFCGGQGWVWYRLACTPGSSPSLLQFEGIEFNASIHAPTFLSDPSESGVKYVQAVSAFRKYQNRGVRCVTQRSDELNVASGWQLDNHDPYQNSTHYFSEGNDLVLSAVDSPGQALTGDYDYLFADSAYVDDRFEMYLVYFTTRPIPNPQRPMAKVPWNWGGLVVFDSDGHHIRYSNSTPGTRPSQNTTFMVVLNGTRTSGDPEVPCPGYGPLSTNLSDSSRELIKFYYDDILLRNPDTVGWNNWTSNIAQCIFDWNCQRLARPNVGVQFFWSYEFRQAIANIDAKMAAGPDGTADYNRRFVYWCYVTLLDRFPDQQGWDNWTNTLNATGDYNAVVFGFIYSSEYRNRSRVP